MARDTVGKVRGVDIAEKLPVMVKAFCKLVIEGDRDATKMARG